MSMQVLIMKLGARVTHEHNTHDYIIGSGLVTIQPQREATMTE